MKCCLVPQCQNNSNSAPEKLFLSVPKGEQRKKWITKMRRYPISLTSQVFVCEDHFNLEEDVEDWMRYKICKEANLQTFILKLKPGVLPHRFDCQADRKRAHTNTTNERSVVAKRRRLSILKDALESGPSTEGQATSEIVLSNEEANSNLAQMAELTVEVQECVLDVGVLSGPLLHLSDQKDNLILEQTSDETPIVLESGLGPSNPLLHSYNESEMQVMQAYDNISNVVHPEVEIMESVVETEIDDLVVQDEELGLLDLMTEIDVRDVTCQVNITAQCKSKKIQVEILPITKRKSTQTLKEIKDKETSTISIKTRDQATSAVFEGHRSDTQSSLFSSEGSDLVPRAELDSSFHVEDLSEDTSDDQQGKFQKLQDTIKIMEAKPKLYLGLDHGNMKLIDLFQKICKCPKSHIFMVLRKLRLDENLEVLGDNFVLSKSRVSRIVKSTLPNLAVLFKTHIYWPEKDVIKRNLPISFRANFSNVESIIDCFEIQIERPSDPTLQALTWSEYKKCNTLKYLISSTPDGFINFLSKGYGGRASDVNIVEDSNYLEMLRPTMCIMADRGFKTLETVLAKKQCHLVRPPSVKAGEKLSPDQVKRAKTIASLRVHIERVISRIRDFKFLVPHSTFHHEYMDIIDSAVIIVCGLVNIQGPLIL